MIVYRKGTNLNVVKNIENCSDIFDTTINIEVEQISLLLLYMDVSDKSRNITIKRCLEKRIESMDIDKKLMFCDFNGHLGSIGRQDINWNGKLAPGLMEKYNLILFNYDCKCKGGITRQQGAKSSIGFIFVNQPMHHNFMHMTIDEDKELFGLSDHCFLILNLSIHKT